MHRRRLIPETVVASRGRSLGLAMLLALVVVAASACSGASSSPSQGSSRSSSSSRPPARASGSDASTQPPAVSEAGSGSPPATGSPSPGTSAGATHAGLATARPVASPIPVPSNLVPPLAQAAADAPVIYSDGCHLGFRATLPPTCAFGDLQSATTVVLFGDSKAGQWFPALVTLASQHHWRILAMTKSACPAANVTPWNTALGRAYTECDIWRATVLQRIAAEHPAAVVISEDRLYQLAIGGQIVPVANALPTWYAGLQQTLRGLAGMAGSVLLVGDTPRARNDPTGCLMKHLTNLMACANPARAAIDQARLAADMAVATAAEARFVDPTPWVCPSDPCAPILGTTLVNREVDHLTATFAAQLAAQLGTAIGLP